MEDIQSIKLNIIYGEEDKSDSLKAYKAEGELRKAINNNKENIEQYLLGKYEIPASFSIKNLGEEGKEEYSLIDIINSKLINSSIKVTLDIHNVYKQYNIETAIERLHLHSNLNII